MRLLIQPGDGIKPLIKAIQKAKKSVEILIFRFDRNEIEKALVEAVERGVRIQALIAFTNRGGESNLRKLEARFLAKGISVARTAGDLVRYHGKMMIVDRTELHVLGFNFTHLDIDHSRSYGLITRNPKLVQEAIKLFEADCQRQAYKPTNDRFLVSPLNSREQLAEFIKAAKKELLIYDPKVSDRAILRILQQKKKDGVDVRVIGKSTAAGVEVRELGRMRLHARVIVRDGVEAFLGSQSLRQLELDARREIGVIFKDAKIIKSLSRHFEEDWKSSDAVKSSEKVKAVVPVAKTAKKVAKAIAKNMPVDPMVSKVVKAIKKNGKTRLEEKHIAETVKIAVKQAVSATVKAETKKAVRGMLEEAAS